MPIELSVPMPSEMEMILVWWRRSFCYGLQWRTLQLALSELPCGNIAPATRSLHATSSYPTVPSVDHCGNVTRTGTALAVVVPFPSWPFEFAPQQ